MSISYFRAFVIRGVDKKLIIGIYKGWVGAMTYRKKYRLPATRAQEYVCQCPCCLTVETLCFRDDILVPTTRFNQGEDGRIYHNCNQCSSGLCRLFPTWKAKPQTL